MMSVGWIVEHLPDMLRTSSFIGHRRVVEMLLKTLAPEVQNQAEAGYRRRTGCVLAHAITALVPDQFRGRRLGVLLWRFGFLSEVQLRDALIRQRADEFNTRIGRIVVQLGFCREEPITTMLAIQQGVGFDAVEF